MGRRSSDRLQFRMFVLMTCMAGALAVLASVLGYTALAALGELRDGIRRVMTCEARYGA